MNVKSNRPTIVNCPVPTALLSDDAFLVVDENHNGRIDGGRELIGGGTTGPAGFPALRAYDEFETPAGQQADMGLTPRDPLFKRLLLWTDTNHNGLAEEDKLEAPVISASSRGWRPSMYSLA